MTTNIKDKKCKIHFVINGEATESKEIFLSELLEWFPAYSRVLAPVRSFSGMTLEEYYAYTEDTRFLILKQCSEAYWMNHLSIDFDVSVDE